ncbi:hypothetical protein LUZ63_019622 [Rhynchospora breviuscula]|uniref:Uncharacterized protein n=1 Tax=Rhynchospora breviuscula TaxID=2022672 RepID=A0A9Q0C6J4_9POAL|nr:hypothetical protein LUZ63_019622 [Rhynchospora breviuscula]
MPVRSLFNAVSAFVFRCKRGVARATRRLTLLKTRRVILFNKKKRGIWQRQIMMGERCQPLDFSGVIYYDINGKMLDHPPSPKEKSPRPSIDHPIE